MEGNCAICGQYGSQLEKDHIRTRAQGSGDEEWEWWPVHRYCHILKHRHGLSWITEKYPHTINILKEKGWELVEVFGRWKLTRLK